MKFCTHPILRYFKTSVLSFALTAMSLTQVAHAVVPVQPAEKRKSFDFNEAALIPVQAGGRVKPFDSYARDSILQITGRAGFEGWDPVDLMLSWLVFPKEWESKNFILISRKDVKRQLGLDEERSRFSPIELLNQSFLRDYANTLNQAAQGMSAQAAPIGKTSKPDQRDKELRTVFDRIQLYRAIISGEAWPVVPAQDTQPWLNLAMPGHDANQIEKQPGDEVRKSYLAIFATYMANQSDGFKTAAAQARTEVIKRVSNWDETLARKVTFENWYNRTHPFQWAWIFYVAAAILWVFTRFVPLESGKKLVKIALPLTLVGFLFHTVGFAIRCYIAGRPPVTNMYESIVWVSYGILIFSMILWRIQKNTIIFAVSTAMGAIALIVSDAAPAMIDPGIHPLVPVLRSNYWLTIHVMTITISYAAFALTMGLGNVSLYHFIRGHGRDPEGMKKISTLNLLMYRSMQFGVVLLAAGTILGGIWADYSWGRFWGWDPKEVWALIALMGYLIVIHARFTGWMKPFGFAAWTVIAFTLVLMAWYGVNFVLGVGLHSYGFSSGGQGAVSAYVFIQSAYVIWAKIAHEKWLQPKQ
jgi:cytochrome c-type biogenesis protein CcsB